VLVDDQSGHVPAELLRYLPRLRLAGALSFVTTAMTTSNISLSVKAGQLQFGIHKCGEVVGPLASHLGAVCHGGGVSRVLPRLVPQSRGRSGHVGGAEGVELGCELSDLGLSRVVLRVSHG
jgi:hypothetical protein